MTVNSPGKIRILLGLALLLSTGAVATRGDAATLVLKDESGERRMEIGGRLQFLYQNLGQGPGRDMVNTFVLKQVRLMIRGQAFDKVAYEIEPAFDLMDQGAASSLKDAKAVVSYWDWARVTIGRFKTPLSRQNLVSDGQLEMIDRARPVVLAPNRATGLQVSGVFPLVEYAAGVFQDANVSMGRFVITPFGPMRLTESDAAHEDRLRLSLGGSAAYARGITTRVGEGCVTTMFRIAFIVAGNVLPPCDTAQTSVLPKAQVSIANLEGAVAYQGVFLTGEYLYADYRGPLIAASSGFFVQGGVFLVPRRLEVAVRYEEFSPDLSRTSQEDVRWTTAGVTYLVRGHDLKVQVNAVHKDEAVNPIDNETVLAMVQLVF